MKASIIYINKEGIPCAPINEVPKIYCSTHFITGFEFLKERKSLTESCIPISEEWGKNYIFSLIVYPPVAIGLSTRTDCFYHTDRPYEFDLEPTSSPNPYDFTARIIRPSEPKADPKEKELNDDLNRVKRWAAKKLSICEEIEFEDREDALFNKGYMNALEDMIMEIEMHLPK